MNKTLPIVRWTARILSILILLFWGYFIAAHLLGGASQPSRPLTTYDSIQLVMMALWLAGLAVAWRWELAGAVMALAGSLVGGLINPQAMGLALVPAVPAVLFLCCGWMSQSSHRESRSHETEQRS